MSLESISGCGVCALTSVVRAYTYVGAAEYKDFDEWNPDPKIHVRWVGKLRRNGH